MGKMTREEMCDHDSDIANEQMAYLNRKRKPFVKVPKSSTHGESDADDNC